MRQTDFINEVILHHPGLSCSSLQDLDELVNNAQRLRMAVAFWTINPARISNNLSVLLSKKDSFACVDFHKPTSIDHICDLADCGANMFFHSRKLQGNNPDGGFSLPTNLLHSKILLFDLDNNQAELWVGSHNWTGWALDGGNIETSLRVKIENRSKVYSDAANLLDFIKSSSYPVISDDRGKYKLAQDSENTVSAISVVSEKRTFGKIDKKSRLYIFSTEENDAKSIPKPRSKNIYVTVRNIENQEEVIFLASIQGLSFLPKADPKNSWVDFEEGFWIQHENIYMAPKLRSSSIPPKSALEENSIFVVTLILEEKLPSSYKLFPKTPKVPYIPVNYSNQEMNYKVGELPLDCLEQYQGSESNRVQILYGDKINMVSDDKNFQKRNTEEQPEEEIIFLGYDGPRKLVQKLVLKEF